MLEGMSTPEPPTEQNPQAPVPQAAPENPPPAAPRRRFRFTRFGLLLAAAGLGILVVGGVIGALAFPRSVNAHLPGRPGVERMVDPGGPEGGQGRGHGQESRPGPGMAPGIGRTGPMIAGTVVSVSDGTLVVAPDGGGAQRTLHTDANTRFGGPGAGQQVLTGLKPGQRVVVEVQGTGATATATAVRAPIARVVGTVTALTGTTATVTATDGLVVQVDVSKANPVPVVGDGIAAAGPVTGTTITADQVRVLPKAS